MRWWTVLASLDNWESKTLLLSKILVFTLVVIPRPNPFLMAKIKLSSEWNSRKDLFSSPRRKNVHIPAGRLAKREVSLPLPLPALLHSSIDLDRNLLEYHFNHCVTLAFLPLVPLVLLLQLHPFSFFCGFHGLDLPLISLCNIFWFIPWVTGSCSKKHIWKIQIK